MSSNKLIIEAFQNTNLEYLKTIEDRSGTGGSQWIGGKIPWQVLAVLDWCDYIDCFAFRRAYQEGCKYFSFTSPLPIGYQRIKLLSAFVDLSDITIVQSQHGTKELVCEHIAPEITHTAILIVGPSKQDPSKLVVRTAYPGILTASLEAVPCFNGTYESLEAVKLSSDYPVAVKQAVKRGTTVS